MSDFSLFSLFTAGLAFASGVSAWTKPVGATPEGNPISQPGLNSLVPAGKPFTVTWEPTTKGTVTLVLLKGPSTNAEPQYAIVEKIENDGSYVWTPSKDLAPTTDATGYGIQLIDDKTGQYQYTTQFGISNPSYDASSQSSTTPSSSAAASTSSASSPGSYGNHGHGGWGHSSLNVHSGYTHPASASGTASASGMTSSYTTSSNGTSTSAGHAMPTGGYMTHNVTMIQPTGGYQTSKPHTSGVASPTGGVSGGSASNSIPAGPQATGNGAAVVVSSFGSLVLAAGAAVLVL